MIFCTTPGNLVWTLQVACCRTLHYAVFWLCGWDPVKTNTCSFCDTFHIFAETPFYPLKYVLRQNHCTCVLHCRRLAQILQFHSYIFVSWYITTKTWHLCNFLLPVSLISGGAKIRHEDWLFGGEKSRLDSRKYERGSRQLTTFIWL